VAQGVKSEGGIAEGIGGSLYFRVEAASCRFQKKRRDAASTLQAAEPARFSSDETFFMKYHATHMQADVFLRI